MPQWTLETMTGQLVRYADLVASQAGLLDTRAAGSREAAALEEMETFSILVPGSAGWHTHLCEPHSFQVSALRQSFGCATTQYSLETAEVFVVHSGQWRLSLGPSGEDGSLMLAAGDVVSVPCNIFRGIAKLDEGAGFLWMPQGQLTPGNASSPAVFEAAMDHGLSLITGGQHVDTSNGDYQLRDSEPQLITTDDAASPTPLEQVQRSCVRAHAMTANARSPLAATGVAEAGVIAALPSRDSFLPGPIAGSWSHGFSLRRLTLASGAYVPLHARQEAEVLFVQQGTLEVSWDGGALIMGAGDTLSVPVGLPRAFRNTASVPAEAFVVRGSEDPALPVFSSP